MGILLLDGLAFACGGAAGGDPGRDGREQRVTFTNEFGGQCPACQRQRQRRRRGECGISSGTGTHPQGARDGRSPDGPDPVERDGG